MLIKIILSFLFGAVLMQAAAFFLGGQEVIHEGEPTAFGVGYLVGLLGMVALVFAAIGLAVFSERPLRHYPKTLCALALFLGYVISTVVAASR